MSAKTQDLMEDALWLRGQGESWAWICDHLGVTPNRVWQWMRRHGQVVDEELKREDSMYRVTHYRKAPKRCTGESWER